MQIYFKRSIQATLKLAADQIGAQKEGAMDIDYKNKWIIKGDSTINADNTAENKTTWAQEGAVSYEKEDVSTQSGVISQALWLEE